MANIKEIFDITFETLPDGFDDEIYLTKSHGKFATFDDNSAIGFLDNDSEITELLFGVFVPNIGLEFSTINVQKNSDSVNVYNAWAHEQDQNHWHGTHFVAGINHGSELGHLRATFESLGLDKAINSDILAKYQQALAIVQANNNNLDYLNKKLSDADIKATYEKIKKDLIFYNDMPLPELFSEDIEPSSIWDAFGD